MTAQIKLQEPLNITLNLLSIRDGTCELTADESSKGHQFGLDAFPDGGENRRELFEF